MLGQVERLPHPTDRRAATVRLTPPGRAAFGEMARAHAGWIEQAFAGLEIYHVADLMAGLARLKRSVRGAQP